MTRAEMWDTLCEMLEMPEFQVDLFQSNGFKSMIDAYLIFQAALTKYIGRK